MLVLVNQDTGSRIKIREIGFSLKVYDGVRISEVLWIRNLDDLKD